MQKAKNLAKKVMGKDSASQSDPSSSHLERNRSSFSSASSSSELPSAATGDHVTDAKAVAVGLPDVGKVTQTATYTDTTIKHGTRDMPVGEVVDKAEPGVGMAPVMEQVTVPKVTMVEETVLVPDVRIERQHKMMPVTVTKLVPVQQDEVVMRSEEVIREEVVMEKEHVEKPITVLKPVTTEVPAFAEQKVMLPRPHEVMKKVKVIRPENVYEDVKVQQPVARKRMVKVVRPVVKRKMVTVERPVPYTKAVNITVPEIREGRMEIQVPVTQDKAVEYHEPVTVIRRGDDEGVQPATGTHDGTHLKPAAEADVKKFNAERNVKDIPVGLPFTEMVKRVQNFSVTKLATEVADYRETWMQPMQVQQQQYTMEKVDIEVTETVMEEFEEEIEEIILEETIVPVVVTVLPEVEEEWPIVKERAEEVWTSEVTLEPESTTVPELDTKFVSQEVPRTIQFTETVQKPETVSKTVMVEQAFTEQRQVSVEVPVEGTREMLVQRPVITNEVIEVEGVVGKETIVHTQAVEQNMATVPEDTVSQKQKAVPYQVAQTVMKPTAVEGPVKVEGDVALVGVPGKDFVQRATDTTKGLEQQAGVHAHGHIVNHHLPPQVGSVELGQNVTSVTPDARLPGAVLPSAMIAGEDGFLRSEGSVDAAKGLAGQPAVIGATMPGERQSSVGTSVSSHSKGAVVPVMPTDVPTYTNKHVTPTDAEVRALQPDEAVMTNTDATKPKKGLFGKVKSALTP